MKPKSFKIHRFVTSLNWSYLYSKKQQQTALVPRLTNKLFGPLFGGYKTFYLLVKNTSLQTDSAYELSITFGSGSV